MRRAEPQELLGHGVDRLLPVSRADRVAVPTRDEPTLRAPEIVDALREHCTVLARLPGEAPHGPVNLIYVTAPHRQISRVLATARAVDPDIFFLVERVRGWSENLRPVTNPTGWRAVLKKK